MILKTWALAVNLETVPVMVNFLGSRKMTNTRLGARICSLDPRPTAVESFGIPPSYECDLQFGRGPGAPLKIIPMFFHWLWNVLGDRAVVVMLQIVNLREDTVLCDVRLV